MDETDRRLLRGAAEILVIVLAADLTPAERESITAAHGTLLALARAAA